MGLAAVVDRVSAAAPGIAASSFPESMASLLLLASDARVRLGEVNRRLFGLLKGALRVRRQERGLEPQVVDGGDAGLVEPRLEVGGLVVDPEGRRREAGCIGAGGQHQG